MGKTILVTGGSGFIGSSLIDYLIDQKYTVICLDNFDTFYPRPIKQDNIRSAISSPLYQLIEGDIRDKGLLENIFRANTIDTIVHLAAKAGVRPSILNPQEYMDVNINGTLNILETMKAYHVKKIIFASSSSIYGNNEKIPYSESDNVDHPISPYAGSKKSGELLTHIYHHLFDFNVINFRFFTVYGPRQRPDQAIHRFFKNIYADIPIEVYGDGTTSRDYTYIADIVSGISKAISYLDANKNVYETINLGNHNPITLSGLIDLIESVTQRKFVIKRMPMQMGDVNVTFADISKAQRLLGYNPDTPLKEGLVKFKKWYEATIQ